MNIFDIVLILLLVMFGLMGFKRGIIKEGVSLAGIILVFLIAFLFKGILGNFLCKYLPFFDFGGNLDGIVTLNILFYQLLAFLLLVAVLLSVYSIILKFSTVLQKVLNVTIVFLVPSKIGGFIVALIEGYILIFVLLITLFIPMRSNEAFTNSAVVNKIIYHSPILSRCSKNMVSSIDEIYDLGDKINKKKITTNQANLKSLDIMLKHNIVSKKTVEQLIALDKLSSVKGTKKVLEKY